MNQKNEKIINEIIKYSKLILLNPNKKLETIKEIKDIDKGNNIDVLGFNKLLENPIYIYENENKEILFKKCINNTQRTTFNIPQNKYLKFLLQQSKSFANQEQKRTLGQLINGSFLKNIISQTKINNSQLNTLYKKISFLYSQLL